MNHKSSRLAIRKVILPFVVGVFVLGTSGSRPSGPKMIWKAEARSPDGLWLASARTEQYSGPGNAGLYTLVYLKRVNVSEPLKEVLLIDYQSAYPSQANVKMNWSSPSHLEVIYDGDGMINSQVASYHGIDISVRLAAPRD